MASITFAAGTVIPSTWLNDVNAIVYGSASPPANPIRVDASGNIGIGVVPSSLLHLQKNQNASTDLLLQNPNAGADAFGSISVSSDVVVVRAAAFSSTYPSLASTGWLYTSTAHPLVFGTGGQERARIDMNGNFGVGTTPSARLHVAKPSAVSASVGVFSNATLGMQLDLASPAVVNDYLAGAAAGDAVIRAQNTLRLGSAGGNTSIGTPTAIQGLFYSGGINAYTATNASGLHCLFQAMPSGANGGALNFYNWNNGGQDINLARIYCQTTSGASGNEAGDLYFYTKPAGGNLTYRFRLTDVGDAITKLNTTAPTLTNNTEMVFTLTSNTNLRISVRGTDGVTRTANITLA